MASVTSFTSKHRGERCWLMGNGPSLNEMELDLLEPETVFASNSIFLLFPRISWRPRYYSCVDTRVLPDIALSVSGMLEAHRNMDGFFPMNLALHDGSGQVIETSSLLARLPNIHYFAQIGSDTSDLPDGAFTLGFAAPLRAPKTVTITLLQLAVGMGYSEIFLIGCDTEYSIPRSVRQSGPNVCAAKEEKLLLTSTQNDDPNHFSRDYFGRGRKWHHPKVHDMQWHYAQAKSVLDSAGIAVFNATVGGQLEVFPRVDYRAVLRS
jgi:hypothetical protein